MTLTNYWWLLIWIFGAGIVLTIVFPKERVLVWGKVEYRWGWIPAIALAFPYVVWAGFRQNFGDTDVYAKTFSDAPAAISQIPSYLAENTKDKGFSVLMILFKSVFGNSTVLFFLVIAAFQMWCLVKMYRKYSTNYWISMFLFIVSTDYLSWMQNGIRQFIAATAIFAGFELLFKKKYVPLICLILLASTIHGSALIMLPIVFIIRGKAMNNRTMCFLVAMVVAILFIDKLTPVLNNALVDTQYSDMMTNEIWTNDDGTNILRVLVYSVPAMLAIIGRKFVRQADDPVINLSINASCVSALFYLGASVSSGIYVGRLPIFVSLASYVAMPWLIDNLFTEASARLVKMVMILGYVVFFYYQMHITWGIM